MAQTRSPRAEAARALVAACGDIIRLGYADDSHLMALGAAMKGSPIRIVMLRYGSFGDAGVNGIAESLGTVSYMWIEGKFTEAAVTELTRGIDNLRLPSKPRIMVIRRSGKGSSLSPRP